MAEKGMHEGHRERMRERYRQTGDLSGFAEHEVLEMLLFYIIPRVNTNDLAHSLLRHFGNIKCVLTADAASLCQVEGMTMKRAEQLRFLGQVMRLAEKESYLNVMADDVNSLRDYLTEFYRYLGPDRSAFFVPADIEQRLSASGSRERYQAQFERFGKMEVPDARLLPLVSLIHRHQKGYDQEGYVE